MNNIKVKKIVHYLNYFLGLVLIGSLIYKLPIFLIPIILIGVPLAATRMWRRGRKLSKFASSLLNQHFLTPKFKKQVYKRRKKIKLEIDKYAQSNKITSLTYAWLVIAYLRYRLFRNKHKILGRPTTISVVLLLLGISITGVFGQNATSILIPRLPNFGEADAIADNIPIGGTASMYPTLPKSSKSTLKEQASEITTTVSFYRYPFHMVVGLGGGEEYLPHRGDIVSFENDKTKEITNKIYGKPSGFVKRIIGRPGDTLEIKDGFVYINGVFQDEPYIADARSTSGGISIPGCQKIEIPKDQYVVMGDNRKYSGDSRAELGLISKKDINHILPFEKQGTLKNHFRDTTADKSVENKVIFDKQKYYEILNNERSKKGLSALKISPQLEQSTSIRIDEMSSRGKVSFDNSSFLAALYKAGYSNILKYELAADGYFKDSELLGYYSEGPFIPEVLDSSTYQEVGVTVKLVNVNGCEAQYIVQHFGGYVPPNYAQNIISGWATASQVSNSNLSTWIKSRGSLAYNQSDLEALISIDTQMANISSNIYYKMSHQIWLTDSENNSITTYNNLIKQGTDLADKLNAQSKSYYDQQAIINKQKSNDSIKAGWKQFLDNCVSGWKNLQTTYSKDYSVQIQGCYDTYNKSTAGL